MEKFNAPDLNGKRFKIKKRSIVDKDFLKRFSDKYPQYDKLTIAQYKALIRLYHEYVINEVIEHRDGVRLPNATGIMFIAACKIERKTPNVDYAKSKQYGVKVTHKNFGTDNLLAKIFYTTSAEKYKFKYKEIWGFKPCRVFKRKVSKNFSNFWNMYHRISIEQPLTLLFNSTYKKLKKAEK